MSSVTRYNISNEQFLQMITLGYVVDGRSGGLVLGRAHDTGNVYMVFPSEGGFALTGECLEGGEYIVNATAAKAENTTIKHLNSDNVVHSGYPISNLPVSAATRVINTHAAPHDRLLWLDHDQFIVNKHATAKHLDKLEEINGRDSKFNVCTRSGLTCKLA